ATRRAVEKRDRGIDRANAGDRKFGRRMTVIKRLSRAEFIAMMAMIFATIAMSIDSMLPALPEIAASMTPDDPNRAQLVVGTFFVGMAIGTVFGGPLSDAFGRKPIMILGCVIYALAAI